MIENVPEVTKMKAKRRLQYSSDQDTISELITEVVKEVKETCGITSAATHNVMNAMARFVQHKPISKIQKIFGTNWSNATSIKSRVKLSRKVYKKR